jgi:hypothetical protein
MLQRAVCAGGLKNRGFAGNLHASWNPIGLTVTVSSLTPKAFLREIWLGLAIEVTEEPIKVGRRSGAAPPQRCMAVLRIKRKGGRNGPPFHLHQGF